jgi:HlyD family secretion protein
MKKAFFVLVILVAGVSAYGYYTYRTVEFIPDVRLTDIARGDIIDTVGATGALEAVTTVQVGSQVSGIIQDLLVDYNSIVREGDVIMRLDPSLFETQMEQARANLARAEADAERLEVSLEDAQTQLVRAEDLADRELISQTELEAAQVAVRSAAAQIKSAEAQVTQARASLNQNQVNLDHTVIRAPIDGIVISRLVDVGQTVAASLQAPELFVIAADLTKMRVIANIDESDVGRIRPGQHVTFTVDAFPAEEFEGAVSQIRLEPIVQQNVVTYATVVDAPNNELKLKPGMTATIELEIARSDNVARIPNSALRFRPSPDIFAALNQPVPELMQLGRPGADSVAGATATDGGSAPAGAGAGPRGGRGGGQGGGFGGGAGGGDPEQRRQMIERMQSMSPEERERFAAERRALGLRVRGRFDGGAATPRRRATADAPTVATVDRGATTIDALFAPLPPTESSGRVWTLVNGQLQAVDVRLGVTDGTATELLGVLGAQSLEPGVQLVINVTTPDPGARQRAGAGGSPLIPQFGRSRGGGNPR